MVSRPRDFEALYKNVEQTPFYCQCEACRAKYVRTQSKTVSFSELAKGYARSKLVTTHQDLKAGYAAFVAQNPDTTQQDWDNLPYTTRARWARGARAAYDAYVPAATPAEVFALKMYKAAEWSDAAQTPLAAEKARNTPRYRGYVRMAEFAMKHGASLENDTDDDDD